MSFELSSTDAIGVPWQSSAAYRADADGGVDLSTAAAISLEYFARALRWLARQPGVDPARIAVLGVSRGSEAAQLLGVYYPDLVHGVIASVPSNVAVCSCPGCTGPAWTWTHPRPTRSARYLRPMTHN